MVLGDDNQYAGLIKIGSDTKRETGNQPMKYNKKELNICKIGRTVFSFSFFRYFLVKLTDLLGTCQK